MHGKQTLFLFLPTDVQLEGTPIQAVIYIL